MNIDASHQGSVARGRLRIYLGYAPGTGTTCALFGEGRQRAEHGTDVVVAGVETQGRPGTEALLAGLEVISPLTIAYRGTAVDEVAYRGTAVEEIDPGAILARSPQVALVDDLAHGNAPGARHATRWQDVEDLLAGGIDVISTVGIAHLESLSDVVAKITGVAPRQTVPDPVVRAADEVQLVDIAPEVLRDRMARGHIYPPRQAEAVLGGWFQAGNLAALRELALLWLATTLANRPQRHRPGGHDPGGDHAREPVVVTLSGGPEGATLIRRAARIAARSGADLLAVHAARPGGPAAAARAALAEQRQLTESLGGSYHQLADDDIPAALLAFADARNATRLILSAARHTRLMLSAARHTRLLSLLPWPGTTQRVIRSGNGIALHVVTCTPTANGVPPAVGEPAREVSPAAGGPTREGASDGAEQHPARPRAAGTAIGPQTASPR